MSSNTKCVKIVRIAFFCLQLRLCCVCVFYVTSHQSFSFFPMFVFASVFYLIVLMPLCRSYLSTDRSRPKLEWQISPGHDPSCVISVSRHRLTACLLFLLLAGTFVLLCSFNSQFVLFGVIFLSCLRALLSRVYSDLSMVLVAARRVCGSMLQGVWWCCGLKTVSRTEISDATEI